MQRTDIIKRSHSTNSIMEFGNREWIRGKTYNRRYSTVQVWLVNGVIDVSNLCRNSNPEGSLRFIPCVPQDTRLLQIYVAALRRMTRFTNTLLTHD